jgi:hypothetical protein
MSRNSTNRRRLNDHMLTISKTIRRSKTPDGGILLDVERGQIFRLNVVGSKIVELLGRGYDEAHIADQIGAAYGTDINTVRRDLQAFLKTLHRHRILKTRPAATNGKGKS